MVARAYRQAGMPVRESGLSHLQGTPAMAETTASGPFQLPELPWEAAALEPLMSARTIEFHYGKHHRGYVDKLNKLVAGTRYADMSLEAIIAATSHNESARDLFNNAAQAWNHTFFWNSLSPKGTSKPAGAIKRGIDEAFGDEAGFRKQFADAAVATFGSGWAWLVTRDGALEITTTGNAGNPLTGNGMPLLVLDVWEHAYYRDYQNDRRKYVEAVIGKLLDWSIAEERLALTGDRLVHAEK
jgi:Fe-Mn family superoxide dismutase